jgi:hypothetical protein
MKGGASKRKGSAFEREVCKKLSLWVSKEKRTDLFWRSAMSGGRSTVGRKRGENLAYQAGDVSAQHPDGHRLTEHFYIECKHYRDLDIGAFLLKRGKLYAFWKQTCKEAAYRERQPMLIAKQNRMQTLVLILPCAELRYAQLVGLAWRGVLVDVMFLDFEKMLQQGSCPF